MAPLETAIFDGSQAINGDALRRTGLWDGLPVADHLARASDARRPLARQSGLLWHELRWAVPAFDMMIACGDLLRIGQTFIPVWAPEGYLQHRSLDGVPSGNPFSFLWTMVDAALHRATPFADQVDSHLATICLRDLAADRAMLVTLTQGHRLVASAASEACDNWLTLGLLA